MYLPKATVWHFSFVFNSFYIYQQTLSGFVFFLDVTRKDQITPVPSFKSQEAFVFPICWPLPASSPVTWTCQRLGCWNVERLERGQNAWGCNNSVLAAHQQASVFCSITAAFHIPSNCMCSPTAPKSRLALCCLNAIAAFYTSHTHTSWDVAHWSTHRHTQTHTMMHYHNEKQQVQDPEAPLN